MYNGFYLLNPVVVVRWQQGKNGKEPREEVKYEQEIREEYKEDKTGTACIFGGKVTLMWFIIIMIMYKFGLFSNFQFS